MGELDEQVLAQWQTHTLLQRRDAELEYRAHLLQKKQKAEGEADEGEAGERREDAETEGRTEKIETVAAEQREAVTTNGHNGSEHEQTEMDRKETKKKKRERVVQSTTSQPHTDSEPQLGNNKSMEQEEHEQRKKERKRKREQHSDEAQPSQQPAETMEQAVSVTPLAEIDIDSPAATPLPQPQTQLPAHGMQEIEINIDDDADTAPPQPPQPAFRQPLPLPPPPPPPPPSRLSLLSVLTFLLPSRDPASYTSWSVDTLVQRIQAEYTSQLYDLCVPTELSTELLWEFAHLLSPVVLPTSASSGGGGASRPVYVDGEVCRLIREVAAHVMAAIEGTAAEEEAEEDSAVPVDEARLALSEVVRVSGMIGMAETEIEPIRRWLKSITPAVKPLAVARPSLTNGTHQPSISYPSPSPSRASTSSSSSSPNATPSPSSSSSSGAPSTSSTPVSLTAAIAAAKPRYIVLDGANIGRWSGSGDPSTDVTVTTSTSRPSHLQHLPSTDTSRTMSRLASWQLVAAVHAVEQQLNIPALICLPEQFIRRPERFAVQDPDLLLLLQKQGKLHRLPTGADDDSQLIRMAEQGNTWIVTNDNFRDHVYSGRVEQRWVDERVIKFYTIEFPRVGGGSGSGGGGGGGVKSEEEVKEKGQVCLVEPSALRRNMHAKEEMEREREREEAEAAGAAQLSAATPAGGVWFDGQQQHVSKTGYPSIMSFSLHPPPQARTGQPHYFPPPAPPATMSYPPHVYHPPPDMYMPYPPPHIGHPGYPPVGPYWPAAAPPSGPHAMPYSAPPNYPPPPALHSPRSTLGAPSPVYPPGALRPEHFPRSRRH